MAIHIPQGYYSTIHDFARATELSEQTIKRALKDGRIAGAILIGTTYLIPSGAVVTGRSKVTHGRYVGISNLAKDDLTGFLKKRGIE